MDEKYIEDTLKSLLPGSMEGRSVECRKLAQSGSPRQYFRLSDGRRSFIGTFSPDPEEGRCFVELAADFRGAGRAVPEVYAVSPDFRFYLQEDLGETSLFSILGSPEAVGYIKETLKCLVMLQKTPENLWMSDCLSSPFSRRQVLWDLNYFKYEYLKPMEVVFDEERLEDDFERLADRLVSMPDDLMGFMMRDCQSRNVMLTDRGPVFIDFQGGRRGPVLYDVVSMLWQARAGFDKGFREEMLQFYCEEYCEGNPDLKERMLSYLSDIVLFRTLQVLGAYGFRGLVQRKAHFLLSVPGALANLREVLDGGALEEYPELKRCAECIAHPAVCMPRDNLKGLTVEIYSFSYKKGYPEDLSGNGGGFMFDCRAMHNPGRYDEYKSLTGRDSRVQAFLESRGEVGNFLCNAWALTDPAIERYLARGFSHLQIGFGCTGGQHRSVYCAERTAEHVRGLFPEVNVNLIHREHPE